MDGKARGPRRKEEDLQPIEFVLAARYLPPQVHALNNPVCVAYLRVPGATKDSYKWQYVDKSEEHTENNNPHFSHIFSFTPSPTASPADQPVLCLAVYDNDRDFTSGKEISDESIIGAVSFNPESLAKKGSVMLRLLNRTFSPVKNAVLDVVTVGAAAERHKFMQRLAMSFSCNDLPVQCRFD